MLRFIRQTSRTLARLLVHKLAKVIAYSIYRFRIEGQSAIPRKGAAVLACNHVSFIDAVLIMAASPRPVYFIMDYRIFANPFIGWFLRLCGAIPIAPKTENAALYEAAFERCAEVLSEGGLLALFPEGGITRDGQLQPFKSGLLKITERTPVPVIPMGLQNLWGSFFSRVEGSAMVHPLRRGLRNRVTLKIGTSLEVSTLCISKLQEQIAGLSKA